MSRPGAYRNGRLVGALVCFCVLFCPIWFWARTHRTPTKFNPRDAPAAALPLKVDPAVRSIVYVCETADGARSAMPALKREVRNSIGALTENQSFNLVFFTNIGPRSLSRDGKLLPAVGQNKDTAYDLLENVRADGGTDPAPALELACASEPEVIVLISDGGLRSWQTATEKLREINSNKRVRVNVIVIARPSEVLGETFVQLQRIAHENSGSLQFVTR